MGGNVRVAVRRGVPLLRYAPRFFQFTRRRTLSDVEVRAYLFEKIPNPSTPAPKSHGRLAFV
jgi:hypothetical protein